MSTQDEYELAVLDLFRGKSKEVIAKTLDNLKHDIPFMRGHVTMTRSTMALMSIGTMSDGNIRTPPDAKQIAINVLEVLLKHKQ